MCQSVSEFSSVGKWVVAASVVLGLSLVISASFIQRGYVLSKDLSNQNLGSVTGIAEKVVDSDKAKWSIQLSRPGNGKIEDTAKNMKEDEKALRALLAQAGITDAVVSIQPATISPGEGSYSSQVIVVETSKVAELSALTQFATTELSKRNASLSSNSIEYYYSGMTQLQKELTKLALEDAKSQAKETLGLSDPRVQSVGYSLPVITPENASMYNNYGNTDTSSIKKKVTMNVSVSFFLK
jgi:hypothetical protein